ncbi:hypothetical protein SUDANB176_07630 (plasmid) [Streptomyces sp. enrichment culture]
MPVGTFTYPVPVAVTVLTATPALQARLGSIEGLIHLNHETV